ncbi:beta-ketoacyl synthase N-terminal-like domain-containing protein [Flavicella marina]|uniref:beta-ketoacyl synthase N-terminal-like domain-containing protein n=1 Tax=Flavicella marina TaxID=1475951 RepID=UPI0012645854|nr:beta-ketoacyl synthase N-terminal-like domain-containing protein [Flavicella marina]
MDQKISITAMASISSLGSSPDEIWQNYLHDKSFLSLGNFEKFEAYVGAISEQGNKEIQKLKEADPKYKNLDRSVLMAMLTSRKAIAQVDWEADFGVNIGSSRGATELFENYYDRFKEDVFGKTATLTSPTTTLGNIASWVAQDLQTSGPDISHSITCSTALHSVLNGIAWIRSGMSKTFLVGGSEAANTAFTIAQMRALKIYASDKQADFPCRALDFEKESNTMVVGEGAVALCLEKGVSETALAVIEGVGYATEELKHNISISANAECFQKSMKMALKSANLSTVDAIVMHAPGTLKGDTSEFNAIQKVFGENIPALTTNKWKIGHTLGTSGVLSLELAVMMLEHQQFVAVPFSKHSKEPKQLKTILVNSVGFGGNAVSILLSSK